jgi:hypothetical protein
MGNPGSPGPNVVSISDMDVRALKTLYTPGAVATGGRPSSPSSPTKDSMGPGVFSVEAFAQRVQALISDDRALMERLIRFAQAHDLLKKNAERAQKLAQESNVALETYQKQVRTLEEHLARSDGSYVCNPYTLDMGELTFYLFFCLVVGLTEMSRSSSWRRKS